MSKRVVYLTEEQWRKIEPLIPNRPVGPKGGRPRTDDRLVFEGILLGSQDRSQMAGSSGPISESFNLLASPERMV